MNVGLGHDKDRDALKELVAKLFKKLNFDEH